MNRIRPISLVVIVVSLAIFSSCDSNSDEAGTTTTGPIITLPNITLPTLPQPPCAFLTVNGECVDPTDYVNARDVKDAVGKINELIEEYRSRKALAPEINQAAVDLERALNRTKWTTSPNITRLLGEASVATSPTNAEQALRAFCAALPNRFGC